ncbi:HD-GYP domain-containing protein [Paenibacillus thalictri]|uniref:HD domain-containing protein n=1 Tax=Paenibacillus thalictri TaxID=2527873 RepID=A0A4Q9DR69_9BACL|nr:HD domain-containing phosphohydrolase [Paenibacillus thalictri]TBL76079.1 HD domain-containing protein [Paenibacillus thalictri]
MRYRLMVGPALTVVVTVLLFIVLQSNPSIDKVMVMPSGHFYIVSAVAFLATLIAIAVAISSSKIRNIQVTLLSLAFISLAETFLIHGLSTPNFIMGPSHLPSVAAQISVLLATFWLFMSTLRSDNPVIRLLVQYRNSLVFLWTLILAVFGVISILFSHVVDFLPLDIKPFNQTIAGLTTVMNIITMYRYIQYYRYSRFPLQLSIVYGSSLLVSSQFIMVAGVTWHISWWLYHFLLLASMLIVITGLIKQYANSRSLVNSLRALFTSDPVERITSCLSPSIKALMIATESRDTYTAGHNLRVTMYALKLAEEMHINPEHLRAIAQGTIVHDVGKIHIPDSILNKAGKLTPEERAHIELHPSKGYEMCRSLGFMQDELDIILSHHEKWDGSGYPNGLKGEQIPLLARIVAVADVYDALTSNRSYRKAWSHEEALKLLIDQKGTHFDPACVEAWVHVCEKEPSVYKYPLEVVQEDTSISQITEMAK